MKKNWDYEELASRQKLLKYYRQHPFYKQDVEVLKAMKQIEKSFSFPQLFYNSQKLFFQEKEISTLYPKYLAKFWSLIKKAADIALKNSQLSPLSTSSNLSNNFSNALKESAAFAHSLPYPYNQKFLYWNQNGQYLYSKMLNENIAGITFTLHYPSYQAYFVIYPTQHLTETIIHEQSHAIFTEKEKTTAFPFFLLNETEGFFFNKQTRTYLKKDSSPDPDYLVFLEALESLVFTHLAYQSLQKYKYINHIYITENYYQLGYTYPLRLNKDLENNILRDLRLFFSYLSFLDLDKIAHQDVEKALVYLNHLRTDISHPFLEHLQTNQITFFKDDFITLERKKVETNRQIKENLVQ